MSLRLCNAPFLDSAPNAPAAKSDVTPFSPMVNIYKRAAQVNKIVNAVIPYR
jgi:hypothetical protein